MSIWSITGLTCSDVTLLTTPDRTIPPLSKVSSGLGTCRTRDLERLSTDEAMGIEWDSEGVSRLPNGSYAVCCTSCAERVIELATQHLGCGGEIFGWAAGTNPTSVIAGPTNGARLDTGQGHDFAIIDGRYLVDPWAKHTECSSDRAAFDLDDPLDRARVRQLYGDPRTWMRRVPRPCGEYRWVSGRPRQLR